MDDFLLKIAESGEWRNRAINILLDKTTSRLDIIIEYVNDYWQNLLSDKENIENFKNYLKF